MHSRHTYLKSYTILPYLVLVGTVSKGRIGDALRSCVEISEEYPTSTKEELRAAPVTRHCERRSKQAATFCGSSLVTTLV